MLRTIMPRSITGAEVVVAVVGEDAVVGNSEAGEHLRRDPMHAVNRILFQ